MNGGGGGGLYVMCLGYGIRKWEVIFLVGDEEEVLKEDHRRSRFLKV